MEQPNLFAWSKAEPPKSTQAEHLDRVSVRIGRAIVAFCAEQGLFHADDLRAYVTANVGIVAPGSADRILRDLRQRGCLNYRVVNRRDSLYEMIR